MTTENSKARSPHDAECRSKTGTQRAERIVDPHLSPAQARGRQAEDLAARHLEAHGLRVLERNARCRGGEVDLVCLDRGTVVFVEVRLRTGSRFGGAAESITAAKRRRILLAAQWWLGGAGQRLRSAPCRFDAVLLDGLGDSNIDWLPGAFDAG